MPAAKNDSDEFKSARVHLEAANRIYFLGFGYHDDNMRRLGSQLGKPFGKPNSSVTMNGTAFEISDPNRAIISRKYPKLALGRADLRITELLDNCHLFLEDVEP